MKARKGDERPSKRTKCPVGLTWCHRTKSAFLPENQPMLEGDISVAIGWHLEKQILRKRRLAAEEHSIVKISLTNCDRLKLRHDSYHATE